MTHILDKFNRYCIDGCPRVPRYWLYITYPEGKEWSHVCKECEKRIGDENLKEAELRDKIRGRYGTYPRTD
jgi:hypothetical protein